MKTTSHPCAVPLAGAALCIVAIVALAGDLEPPPGPVTPTVKTLDQVEPRTPINLDTTPGDIDSLYRIDRPGSYYLTHDTPVRSAQSGIEIAASHVTVDLMGFRIYGLAGSLHAISIEANVTAVQIRNGFVTQLDGDGIHAGTGVESLVIERVSAISNGGGGVAVGDETILTRCVARENGGPGFSGRFTATDCRSRQNGAEGFLGSGSFRGCLAEQNTGTGFWIDEASTFDSCQARGGLAEGFVLDVGACALTNCLAKDNDLQGFTYTFSNSNVFIGCAALSNGSDGLHAPPASTITACVASNNAGNGIVTSGTSTISNCTTEGNNGDGIQVGSGCIVRDNTCTGNGHGLANDGANIHVLYYRSRIEGNNCIGADRGIDIDGFGNVVIRNHVSFNTTNYDIAANNLVGPIVTTADIATNDSPHANYEYD